MTEISLQSGVDPQESLYVKKTLLDGLDSLLERYLDLVHRYCSLQQDVAKDFASGYFSLAQANFSNHNRLHYGQDFYDDRMQALTTFYINPSTDELDDSTTVEQSLHDTISLTTMPPTGKSAETRQTIQKEDSETSQRETSSEPAIPDPLKWFGILVPPALRATQMSFKHAVIEAIPLLVNLTNEMKSMEIEIRRMRKKIKRLG
ncbi:MAG: hypothetical protein Q9200_001237 [Gallowayella weberi]